MPGAGDIFFSVSKTSGVGKTSFVVEPMSGLNGRGPYKNIIVVSDEEGVSRELLCELTLPISWENSFLAYNGEQCPVLKVVPKDAFVASMSVETNARYACFRANNDYATYSFRYGDKYLQIDGSTAKNEVFLTLAQISAITTPAEWGGGDRIVELRDNFGVYEMGTVKITYKVPENAGSSRNLNCSLLVAMDLIPTGQSSWQRWSMIISQAAGTLPLSVSPTSLEFGAAGGTSSFTITTEDSWTIEEV